MSKHRNCVNAAHSKRHREKRPCVACYNSLLSSFPLYLEICDILEGSYMIKHSNTILTQPAFRISLNLNPLWWLLWKLHKTHQLIVIIITFYLLFFSIKSSTSGKPCITKNWYIKKNKNITSMESMLWPEWFCFLSISFTNRVQSPTTFISQNIITFRHTLIVCCPAIL